MYKRILLQAIVILTGLCWANFNSFAGNLSKEDLAALSQLEDSMVVLADSMNSAPILDDRIELCVRFTKHLRTALDMPNSYSYPFKKLEGKVHILYADDKSFRIFNWLIKPAENVRRYYGAIQMNSDEPVYYPLKDASDQLEDAEAANNTLTASQWYGCEYYKIMPQNIGGQKAYLLFGFNSNGINSNKKLIDVLYFQNGTPAFGMPIFSVPDYRGRNLVRQSRFILEYKKTAQIYLNYDNERKMIIYNRITSEVGDPNRKSTYIPTGQMDGLRWENGMLNYVKEAIPVLILQDGQAPVDGVMKGG